MAKTPPKKTRTRTLKVTTRDDRGEVEVRSLQDDELTPEEKSKHDLDEFLSTARKRWKTINQSEHKLRLAEVDDQKFRAGEQWDQTSRSERLADGRPCLVNNRLPAFIRQITDQERRMRPAIEIDPRDGKMDVATAEVVQGVIRRIEDQSDADAVYEIAGDQQVTSGRGYIEVISDYVGTTDFEQEIFISACPNPLAVFLDTSAQKPDKSDAGFGFILEPILRDEFEERWGKDELSGLEEWAKINDRSGDWMPIGKVTVARYYYVKTTTRTLVNLKVPMADGKGTRTLSVFDDDKQVAELKSQGATVLAKREVQSKQAHFALITGNTILDGNEDKTAGRKIPGTRVPIVPVIGEELNIAGEVDYRGVVRDAKDPQRMDNFWASSIAEAITLAPKAPYIMAEGQDEGYTEMWRQANRKNYAALKYKPLSLGGQQVPPPQRNAVEPAIQAMALGRRQAQDDVMGVIGLHQSNLGQTGPEQSGRAIKLRQDKGDQGTSHYPDHLARAIRSLGRLLVEWIPEVYDTPRLLTINGVDDSQQNVLIHAGQVPQITQPGQGGQPDATRSADSDDLMELFQGAQSVHDLSNLSNNVTVKTGQRFASRREEAASGATELIQVAPNTFPIIGDLLVENLNFPNANKIAARLRKAMDPKLLGDGAGPSPQDVAQMQQQLQEMQAQLAEANDTIKSKKLELESAEKRTAMTAEAQLVAALIKARTDMAGAMASAESDKLLTLIDAHAAHATAQVNAAAGTHQQAIQTQGDIRQAELAAEAAKAAPPQSGA